MTRPIPRLTRFWMRRRVEIEETLGAIVFFALVAGLTLAPWFFA